MTGGVVERDQCCCVPLLCAVLDRARWRQQRCFLNDEVDCVHINNFTAVVVSATLASNMRIIGDKEMERSSVAAG